MAPADPTGGAPGPVVVVPVGTDEQALDACLAALEGSTPAGTRVWLADDAQCGPRGRAVIDAWLGATRMQAAFTRRPAPLGESAHLADVLAACTAEDVVLLSYDARPTPGWLARMQACLRDAPRAATVTPWCNAGETAAWPRLGHVGAAPADAPSVALAASVAAMPPLELPAAVDHAVLLRAGAAAAVGGIDASICRSAYAALLELSLRLAANGHRNLLCTQAFVARDREGCPAPGDLESIASRWPRWTASLADFLMHDPAAAARAALGEALSRLEAGVTRQPSLFAGDDGVPA